MTDASPGNEPLPDPVAYARTLTNAELREYETIYGEHSREWIIAQAELRRREIPWWWPPAKWLAGVAALAYLAYRFFV